MVGIAMRIGHRTSDRVSINSSDTVVVSWESVCRGSTRSRSASTVGHHWSRRRGRSSLDGCCLLVWLPMGGSRRPNVGWLNPVAAMWDGAGDPLPRCLRRGIRTKTMTWPPRGISKKLKGQSGAVSTPFFRSSWRLCAWKSGFAESTTPFVGPQGHDG